MRYVVIGMLVAASLAFQGLTVRGVMASAPASTPGVLNGEHRTYYASGAPFEVRHYVDGREEGLQQAWTEDGQLYLNYEVRHGRRYGYVNARPCEPVHGGGEQ